MAKKTVHHVKYNFFESDVEAAAKALGNEGLKTILKEMLLIRHFEMRAESAYQQGKVGGFFHAYMGQEAIQTAAVSAMGRENNWWITTYRCHALAMLMGATPNEMMAELYGKVTGNAMGRGGSMHLYADRMLGGFGIVGGHLPIATGAAFSLKYQKQKGVAVCFMGDGAFVQGAVHESLNLASLWDLPCIYVVENNQWGMGTAVKRALCVQPIAEHFAPAYGMKAYTLDGMDFLSCYGGFQHIYEEVLKTKRPVLVEVVTERFRGHSISDPGLYRSKEELEKAKTRDPIHLFAEQLKKRKVLTDKAFEALDKEQKEIVIASMKFAEESPNPDLLTLEEDVFAP
ncbi:MAG: pyruvate dehydrogenase (acetyl-transferring) E1 component subunit alpha [Chlamydiia bacterium]|nr:pyruvate dehydrogenase (acetyl-transferring) E1 component subunit alpha [Chlamydiia bacterium]